MQTLIIATQYLENYAGFDEAPRMKPKGGNTYIIRNVAEGGVDEILDQLREFIETSLEDSNGGCEEYIIDATVTSDWRSQVEGWETVTEFWFAKSTNQWMAIKVTDNRDHGWMRKEILEKTEAWTCVSGMDREDYSISYLMEDGDILDNNDELTEWLNSRKIA